jgi:hypothetical protein
VEVVVVVILQYLLLHQDKIMEDNREHLVVEDQMELQVELGIPHQYHHHKEILEELETHQQVQHIMVEAEAEQVQLVVMLHQQLLEMVVRELHHL